MVGLFALGFAFLAIVAGIVWSFFQPGLRRAALIGLAAYVLFFVLGGWSIFMNRSSTAGIGFLFLPFLALPAGILGYVLGAGQTKRRLARENGSAGMTWLWINTIVLLALVLVNAGAIYEIKRVQDKNRAEDARHAEQKRLIRENQLRVKKLLAENPGRESQILADLAAGSKDRTLLIPVARSRYASPELLDRLARSNDFGVNLTAARNPNTAPETLKWIIENHAYPPYFYVALARHAHSPPEILRRLYDKRAENWGILPGLRKNPNTPDDIKAEIEQAASNGVRWKAVPTQIKPLRRDQLPR